MVLVGAAPLAAPEKRAAAPTRTITPETQDQTERIRDARFKYEQMVSRIGQAQLELDAARTGFKYRYGIIVPAEVPKYAIRPKGKVFMAGVLFVAFVIALGAVVGLEAWQGRIYDSWRLAEALDIPLLAEIGET
jgi:hypothetical protein